MSESEDVLKTTINQVNHLACGKIWVVAEIRAILFKSDKIIVCLDDFSGFVEAVYWISERTKFKIALGDCVKILGRIKLRHYGFDCVFDEITQEQAKYTVEVLHLQVVEQTELFEHWNQVLSSQKNSREYKKIESKNKSEKIYAALKFISQERLRNRAHVLLSSDAEAKFVRTCLEFSVKQDIVPLCTNLNSDDILSDLLKEGRIYFKTPEVVALITKETIIGPMIIKTLKKFKKLSLHQIKDRFQQSPTCKYVPLRKLLRVIVSLEKDGVLQREEGEMLQLTKS